MSKAFLTVGQMVKLIKPLQNRHFLHLIILIGNTTLSNTYISSKLCTKGMTELQLEKKECSRLLRLEKGLSGWMGKNSKEIINHEGGMV